MQAAATRRVDGRLQALRSQERVDWDVARASLGAHGVRGEIGMFKFLWAAVAGRSTILGQRAVVSLILPWALIIGGTQWLSADTFESTPQRSIIASAIIFSVIAVVGIWQFVGTWRASSREQSTGPMVDHALDGERPWPSRGWR